MQQSVGFASFDDMKRVESENRFDRKLLRPGDPSDPESFEVRRGQVGGLADWPCAEDARHLERSASRLRL